MLTAADEGDVHNLLESFQGIGLKIRTDSPFDIALLVKYFFRDAKPSAEAKEENSKRRKEYKEKEDVKKNSLYVLDKVDVTGRNVVGWKSVLKAQVVEIKVNKPSFKQ